MIKSHEPYFLSFQQMQEWREELASQDVGKTAAKGEMKWRDIAKQLLDHVAKTDEYYDKYVDEAASQYAICVEQLWLAIDALTVISVSDQAQALEQSMGQEMQTMTRTQMMQLASKTLSDLRKYGKVGE